MNKNHIRGLGEDQVEACTILERVGEGLRCCRGALDPRKQYCVACIMERLIRVETQPIVSE